MTITCVLPDAEAGVVTRLSSYVDCQSRAIGENGFQALVGGPMMAASFSGLATILIALIGYRIILGEIPSLRGSVSWAGRIGVVLALLTSWAAFQTLVYRVAFDAPDELAAIVLPAAGLPYTGIEERVQAAYDKIRLGSRLNDASQSASLRSSAPTAAVAPLGAAMSPPTMSAFQPAPQTASLLVLSTVGITAALHLVVAFLLAVAPIGIAALLFDSTIGLFSGWVRALTGGALGCLGASISTAVELTVVEMELGRNEGMPSGLYPADGQAVVTVVIVFFVVALAMTFAAFRMASAFRLPWLHILPLGSQSRMRVHSRELQTVIQPRTEGMIPIARGTSSQSRADGIAETLAVAARRDQARLDITIQSNGSEERRSTFRDVGGGLPGPAVPLRMMGRRPLARRSGSAARRDKVV